MFASKWTVFVCVTTCFLTCSGSEEKTVQPGEDVTLQCQGPRGADIDSVMLKWIRPDLKSEGSVFFYRDNHTQEHSQHPSFHGRVELTDPQMKDGDVSVILKNVNINDTGTYECHVGHKGNSPKLISSVQLQVKDSGGGAGHTGDGGDKDGGDKDRRVVLAVVLSVAVAVAVAVAVGFVIYRKRGKKLNSNRGPTDEEDVDEP
ncbi:hypothetical protein Q5P01_003002 [Channa striata]|uniref:Ig-like domain-containing protein n=1 Tax=Channa striata TaxID=64152 RepID=A0AA88NV98_CHASR|nr:hypothetical protein Q5P01_003002 [Channa striata]